MFLFQIHVNGSNASPLYKFLKSSKHGTFGDNIKWNFTKFLVDKDGNVVDRFSPTTAPHKLEVKLAINTIHAHAKLDQYYYQVMNSFCLLTAEGHKETVRSISSEVRSCFFELQSTISLL